MTNLLALLIVSNTISVATNVFKLPAEARISQYVTNIECLVAFSNETPHRLTWKIYGPSFATNYADPNEATTNGLPSFSIRQEMPPIPPPLDRQLPRHFFTNPASPHEHKWELGCGYVGCLVNHGGVMRHCAICGKVETSEWH